MRENQSTSSDYSNIRRFVYRSLRPDPYHTHPLRRSTDRPAAIPQLAEPAPQQPRIRLLLESN